MLLTALLMGWMGGTAHADPAATREAMDRLEELLDVRAQDGLLPKDAVMPAILVDVDARYLDSEAWLTTRAIEVLEGAYGGGGLRLCEACMVTRAQVEDGQMVVQTGPVSLSEVIRLDEQTRGASPPARSAIWLSEYNGGVSVRIVDLATGRVLFAQNVDPDLVEFTRTAQMYTITEELERRARGDGLTQSFMDFALFPGQHLSIDWTDQWGRTNQNLSGLTVSVFDPVLGVGASHYRATRLFHTMVGAQLLMSLPTAAVQSIAPDGEEVLDPLLTAAAVVRVPFGRSNYGAVLIASTNGQLGLGISLLNISLLPVLP